MVRSLTDTQARNATERTATGGGAPARRRRPAVESQPLVGGAAAGRRPPRARDDRRRCAAPGAASWRPRTSPSRTEPTQSRRRRRTRSCRPRPNRSPTACRYGEASSALADVDIDTAPRPRLLRHGVRAGSSRCSGGGSALARARDRLHHLRGQVRHADPVAAPHALAPDDAHVVAGGPVRRPVTGRLHRRQGGARPGADRAAALRRRRRRALRPVRARRRAACRTATRSSTVDGTPIDTVADMPRALADRQPGDTVSVTVDRIEANGTQPVTTDVQLIADPAHAGAAIIGFVPFDTRSVHAAVRDRHRHRRDRRPQRRAGVHADADRRAHARRPARRHRRGGDRHDRPRRRRRGHRRSGAEGVGRPSGRAAPLPRAGRAGRRSRSPTRAPSPATRWRSSRWRRVDEAFAALERLGGDPLGPHRRPIAD